jgi:BirA family transcriptional regulator, biotin operon repressor / biotin---[acetyl-CoA-carboxylase] ligase
LIFEQVKRTGSTNADLLIRANEGAPEGLWLRADAQDEGRGRMGREWISPLGNVYASTIIRLKPDDPPAPTLAFVAAVSAHRAISKLSPFAFAQIKWPNDILSNDGAKLCGMLLERNGDAVVVGIGVNLAHHPEGLERPVTSIKALGLTVSAPQEFVEVLAQELAAALATWRIHGQTAIMADWQSRAHPVGTLLKGRLPDGEEFSSQFDGLNNDGALMLRLADGSIRAIHAADVFLV